MIDPRMIRIASNPVQMQMLTLLTERASAAAGELQRELDAGPDAVARNLDELLKSGLVELVDDGEGDGASEPRYRALGRMLWSDEEWALFGQEEQKRLTRWIIDMIDSDANEAIDAGTYTARQNSHASRAVSMIDEQGWEELCRLHDETLEAVFAVETACSERLSERGETGFPALSALLCCELPPRGGSGAKKKPA